MPAARHFSRSPSMAKAVRVVAGGSARTRRGERGAEKGRSVNQAFVPSTLLRSRDALGLLSDEWRRRRIGPWPFSRDPRDWNLALPRRLERSTDRVARARCTAGRRQCDRPSAIAGQEACLDHGGNRSTPAQAQTGEVTGGLDALKGTTPQ